MYTDPKWMLILTRLVPKRLLYLLISFSEQKVGAF